MAYIEMQHSYKRYQMGSTTITANDDVSFGIEKGELAIILGAVLLIGWNIRGVYGSMGKAIQQAAFQVASIITTTGFATVDFNIWPEVSRTILVLLMFVGACAGSTGGGIKVSRFIILLKAMKKEIKQYLHPRQIRKTLQTCHCS
mgnify:FL=1